MNLIRECFLDGNTTLGDIIINQMSPVTNTNLVHGLPRRPRMADASAASLLAAVAAGLLIKDWRAALAGGAAGAALANIPQPLEFAVRNHLESKNYSVVNFYRAPRFLKVTFSTAPGVFWTAESLLPAELEIADVDRDDWLFGNLVVHEIPKLLSPQPFPFLQK